MLKDEFCTLEASRCIILRGRYNSGRLLLTRGRTDSIIPPTSSTQPNSYFSGNKRPEYLHEGRGRCAISASHRTPPPREMILRHIAFPTRRKEKLCRQARRHSFSTIFSLESEISLVPRTIFLFLTPRTILFIGEDFEVVCIP